MIPPRRRTGGEQFFFMCLSGHKNRSHMGGDCRDCGLTAFEVYESGRVERVYGSANIPDAMLTYAWQKQYIHEDDWKRKATKPSTEYKIMCAEGHVDRYHSNGFCSKCRDCGNPDEIAFHAHEDGSIGKIYNREPPKIVHSAAWKQQFIFGEKVPPKHNDHEPHHTNEDKFPFGTFVTVSKGFDERYAMVSKAAWHKGFGHPEAGDGDYVPIVHLDETPFRYNGYKARSLSIQTPTSTEGWKKMRGWK